MIKIELMTHDLVALINNLRDEAQKTEFDRDLKDELHLCQKKIEEIEKEISEADKLIDDSPIFQKTNEPLSNKVARIMIMLERYHRQLNEIEKYVDESKLCFDNTRDIAYKVNEIIGGCNTKNYQGKQLAKYEALIQDAIQAAKKHESQNVIDILNKRDNASVTEDRRDLVIALMEKRMADATIMLKDDNAKEALHVLEGATFHGIEELFESCLNEFYKGQHLELSPLDLEDFKRILKEKLCK